MSSGLHTPEPWHLNTQYADIEVRGPKESGVLITVMAPWGVAADAQNPQLANARRIVACVNFCAGTETEALEVGTLWASNRHTNNLREQRDELLKLTERAESFIAGFEDDELQEGVSKLLIDMRAAIAKGTGVSA